MIAETKKGIFNLFPKTLMLFLLGMVLANIAAEMYLPLLPLYLQNMGADIRQVGLFFTISAVLPLLFQIFGGWISDSVGRLKAVAFGSLAGLFTFIIFFVSPSWQWGLVAMATSAIGRSFVAPSFRAFIAEQSDESNRGKIYGMADTIFAVVGVLGPPLGGIISDRMGYKAMFLIAGIIFSVATIIRIAMATQTKRKEADTDKQESPKAEKPTWKGLKTSIASMVALLLTGGVATWILISDGILDINFNMVGQLMPIYMQNEVGITNTQIGLLNSVSSIVTMALMSFMGWLSDKKGERLAIAGGMVTLSISMTVFVFSRNFYSMMVSWALFGLGNSMISPAYNSLISKAVPEKLRGLAFGLFSTSVGVVALPAPYIGAFLWERFDPRVPFILPTLALLVVVPIVWRKFKIDAQQVPTEGLVAQPVVAQGD